MELEEAEKIVNDAKRRNLTLHLEELVQRREKYEHEVATRLNSRNPIERGAIGSWQHLLKGTNEAIVAMKATLISLS
jgi:hypothetical protein